MEVQWAVCKGKWDASKLFSSVACKMYIILLVFLRIRALESKHQILNSYECEPKLEEWKVVWVLFHPAGLKLQFSWCGGTVGAYSDGTSQSFKEQSAFVFC